MIVFTAVYKKCRRTFIFEDCGTVGRYWVTRWRLRCPLPGDVSQWENRCWMDDPTAEWARLDEAGVRENSDGAAMEAAGIDFETISYPPDDVIHYNRPHKECLHCGRCFAVGPGSGRRSDAKFCSQEHQIQFNRQKPKQIGMGSAIQETATAMGPA